jgi:hypothetical protein
MGLERASRSANGVERLRYQVDPQGWDRHEGVRLMTWLDFNKICLLMP